MNRFERTVLRAARAGAISDGQVDRRALRAAAQLERDVDEAAAPKKRPSALAPRTPADLARRIATPAARDTWPWRRVVRLVSAASDLVVLELECGHRAEDDNHRQRVRCRACGGAA